MGMRWNRESFLVSLVVIMILIAIGYYGYSNLVEPAIVNAESSSRIVSEQDSLLASYPPETDLLEEIQNEYQETTEYLPDEEAINAALVILETTATSHGVVFSHITRINDRQTIEGLSGEFIKTVYQVEVESASPDTIRDLIRSLMNEDRMWSIPTLTVQKQSEDSYTGVFMLELLYRTNE